MLGDLLADLSSLMDEIVERMDDLKYLYSNSPPQNLLPLLVQFKEYFEALKTENEYVQELINEVEAANPYRTPEDR